MPEAQDSQLSENLSADTRQRLLMSAIRVFAEKGFQGAGIREISQKAQANSALVQYYFGNKEGLYRAALGFLFEHGNRKVLNLEPPPASGSSGALVKGSECLRNYVQTFLEDLLSPENGRNSQEFRSASYIFWSRELLQPNLKRVQVVMDHIRPYVGYLTACIQTLRPDLEEEQRFLMGCSIQAQILFFYQDAGLITRLRGAAYSSEDIDRLTNHITSFSLRGLALPTSISNKGGH